MGILASSSLDALTTTPFLPCEARIYHRKKSERKWRRSTRYTLKTRLVRPIQLLMVRNYPHAFRTRTLDGSTVEGRLYLKNKILQQFSFVVARGQFVRERRPNALVLKWLGRGKRILLIEDKGQMWRVCSVREWFKRPVEKVECLWVDGGAIVKAMKGDVRVSRWQWRKAELDLRRIRCARGQALFPGDVLHVGSRSFVRIQVGGERIRTIDENTGIECRGRPLLMEITGAARIRHCKESVRGSIGLYRAEGYFSVPLGREVPLFLGDLVQTGPKAAGEIVRPNQRPMKIGPFVTVFLEHPRKVYALASIMEAKVKVVYEESQESAQNRDLEGSEQLSLPKMSSNL